MPALNTIQEAARDLVLQFYHEYGTTPYEINNGRCDIFAEALVDKLGGETKELFVICMFNMINSEDGDFDGLFEPAIDTYNLHPLDGFNAEQTLSILQQYADTSHVWVGLVQQGGQVLHFDAEAPEGVASPWLLPTFKKLFDFHSDAIDKDTPNAFMAFLRQRKERLNNIFLSSLDTKK